MEKATQKNEKKTAITPVDLCRKTEIYPSCPSWLSEAEYRSLDTKKKKAKWKKATQKKQQLP